MATAGYVPGPLLPVSSVTGIFFLFFWLHPQDAEVPGPEMEPEPWQ